MSEHQVQISLQRKFTSQLLANSVLSAFILVIVLLFWNYQLTIKAHQQHLDSLSTQHFSAIKNALWLKDDKQIQQLLNELKLFLDIDYAEIEQNSKKIISVGTQVTSPVLSKNIKINWIEGTKTTQLGTLNLFIGQSSILAKLLEDLIPLLVIALLAIIILALVNHYNIKNLITNRLINIINTLNHPETMDNFQKQLESKNRGQAFDEIDRLSKEICDFHQINTALTENLQQQLNLTHEVESNLGQVVNSSLDGILVVDASAQVIQANDAFSSLIGEKKQNIDGKNFWDLPLNISKVDTYKLINSSKTSGKQSKQLTIKERLEKRYYDLTLVAVGDKQQQFYAFFQDRTQQQQLIHELEEQYQFIKAVLDNTSDAILACDEKGMVTLYNHRVNKLLNTSSAKIKNDEWTELYSLFREDGITQLKADEYPLYIALAEGTVENVAVVATAKQGSPLHLICNGSRLYSSSGKIIGAVVTAHDVTTEHKARLELVKQQKHLEQQVEIRTADLQQANKELEAFSYSVSHDLKAPLRSINGFAEILHEDYAGLISKSGQDLLQRIMKNASYLGNLIEDLLTLSKISQKEMRFDRLDISKICRELCKEENLNHVDIEYHISDNLSASGDAGLIKIMIQNLLSNAVKYSKPSKPAKIKLFTEAIDGKPWFVLEDNGVGFNNKFKNKIFKPFQRAHGDEYEGNGIGLSIVQRIIQRHQGEINICSKLHKGTRVEFYLPESFNS